MSKDLILGRSILKRSKQGEIRVSGFTLIEILISLILISLGLFFCTKVFIAGKYLLKESENKSRAMEIASIHMNEYLVKSYNDLFTGLKKDSGTADAKGFFSWEVNVTDSTIKQVTTKDDIPYEQIEVICSYTENNVNGTPAKKSVRLINIVPFPIMHLFTAVSAPASEATCYKPKPKHAPALSGLCSAEPATSYSDLNFIVFDMPFTIKVQSYLIIFYNLSIDMTDHTNVATTDLILSKCFIIDTSTGKPVAACKDGCGGPTGTPILTEPTVSNMIGTQKLPKGAYILRVIWFKDHNAGKILAKNVSAIIFQSENEP